MLDVCTDWRVFADVDQQFAFPMKITSTRQRPDIVIWSVNSKKVIIAELTIPFEVNIDWAHQHILESTKTCKSSVLRMAGQQTYFLLSLDDELFISNSTSTFLTKLRLSPAEKREYIKKIQNKTKTASERICHSYRLKTIQ